MRPLSLSKESDLLQLHGNIAGSAEKLINIKMRNKIIIIAFFRTSWGTEIINNFGCFKITFITS